MICKELIKNYLRLTKHIKNDNKKYPSKSNRSKMINAILIEVLCAIAENECNKIRTRQREGIETSKKKNVCFGRPSLSTYPS